MLFFLLLLSVYAKQSDFTPLVQLGKSAAQWKTRIIYQILTDRFARTDGKNTTCVLNSYCGGTYQGIINHLDYIKNLGMNAIWISPVVENTPGSYHGYHATDFYALNTNFGTETDLLKLIKECKKRDIWIMFDLVFNHVGPVGTDYSKINPFNETSHYHEYCVIQDYSNQTEVENCRIVDLPDLNQSVPYVSNELIAWAYYMIKKYDLDGIRIDTIKHVHPDFWQKLVSSIPNIYMLGETFDGNPNYLKTYTDIMKGQMSYPMYYTLQNCYGKGSSMYEIRSRFNDYDNLKIDYNYLAGFVDNHDNNRWLNLYPNTLSLKNALAFTLLSSSIPLVYYGTEQGYNGGADPYNREPLWLSGFSQTTDLYSFISLLSSIRKQIPPLSPHIERYISNDFYSFSRGNVLICTCNNYYNTIQYNINYLPFNKGDKIKEVISGREEVVGEDGLLIKIEGGMPQIWVKA